MDKRAGLKKIEVGEAGFFPCGILWLSAFVGSKTGLSKKSPSENPALRIAVKGRMAAG